MTADHGQLTAKNRETEPLGNGEKQGDQNTIYQHNI
jgi:hypothetical protein